MWSPAPTVRVWSYCTVVCISAALFGGDTGSIGSITSMPQFTAHFGPLNEFERGIVVAVILIPSAVTGLLAGSLMDRISRRLTVSLGCAIFAAGMGVSIAAPSIPVLIVGRCIAGSGEGLFLSAATCYITEISPKDTRGKLVTLFQLFIAGAIALAFFTCYGSIKIQSSLAWRLPFILSLISALTCSILCLFLIPYSPRWLYMQGRKEEAKQVLMLVTKLEDDAERKELLSAPNQGKGKWSDIFAKGTRGRTFLGTFLNVFQQLSGIDFVLFYAPLLFTQAGLDPETSSFVASGVTGIIITVMTALGAGYIDRIGRRTLVLAGGAAMAASLILLGSIYASNANKHAGGRWTAIILIELFALFFSGSWALVVRLFAAEIQPSRTRGAASSFGQGANQLTNTIVALSSPAFLAKSSFGPYFLYGGFMVIGTAVAYVYMPETLGMSLETIDSTFQSTPVAVSWPSILRSRLGEVRQRRGSRRASDREGRPAFPARIGMERLGSSALSES